MKRIIIISSLIMFCAVFLINCGSKTAPQFGIFSETYTNSMLKLNIKNPPDLKGGYMGTWESNPKDITTVVVDTKEFKEGTKSLKVVNGSGPWGGGVWFQFGYDENKDPAKQTADMSGYCSGHLVFWVKTTEDLLIKLESENKSETQVKLSKYNVKLDGTWQEVEIPVKDFTKVDFGKLNVVFGAHFIEPLKKAAYWLDNVHFTKE